MYFLDLPDFWSAVGGGIVDGFRSIIYLLDATIYKFIIYLYNWFLMLCNGRLLDPKNGVISDIAMRFELILGIFMFFVVAISFLKMILDPDKITDKEVGMGAIVKKVLLVVLMFGLSNTAFNFLYDFQSVLLGYNKSGVNVIQRIFSPKVVDSRNFGAVLSTNLFTNFYSVDSSILDSSDQNVVDCLTYDNLLKNQIIINHSFDFGYNCLNARTTTTISNSGGQSSEVYIMDFKFLESIIVGVIVVYMLFMYCIKVGIRMVQLAFLEIISPMAIISYLSPKKDTMFSRWGKAYISTYIDVFIRVAIINLTVYLICLILEGWSTGTGDFWSSLSISNEYTRIFMGVIMILALLTFAKRAPDLLKKLFPSNSDGYGLGFGLGKKDNELGLGLLGGIGAKGAGVLGGAVGGLAGGVAAGSIGGAAFGLLRGGIGGLKNKKLGDALKSVSGGYKGQRDASKKMADIRANGGSFWGAKAAQLNAALGRRTAYDRDQQVLSSYDTQIGYFEAAEKEAESKALKNAERYNINSWDGTTHSLDWLASAKDSDMYSPDDQTKYAREYNRLLKAAKEFNMSYGINVTDNRGSVEFSNNGDLDGITTASGVYTTPADINSHFSELGGHNDVINANLGALGVGEHGSDTRFKTADSRNSANKGAKIRLTTSAEYNRNKANAGK